MTFSHRTLLAAAVCLLASPLLQSESTEAAITKQMGTLRTLSATQRPAATVKLAQDIRALPAGQDKLKLADALANLVTEGDQGMDTKQAVADTLAQALTQSPMPAKGDVPPPPYMDLASLVRYENVTATLDDPLFAKAKQVLISNDEDVARADFTLRDIHGKKVTLSELRGKIVMVNFWATWCPPCRLEMPDLDVIYTHFQSQGLVILSITDEDPVKVDPFIGKMGYHPPVLFDPDGKVHKLFHVEGIPRSFVFNRDGRLVAEAIDQRTQGQFFQMLARGGLHP
jgi:peroxiredoxin